MKAFDYGYLTKATDDDVKKVGMVIEQCKELRFNHATANKGMTKDKSMRFIARIDVKALYHPEWSKYFDIYQDPHERRKNVYKFLRLHPEFMVVDHL